jgi:hypothetical protein
MRTLRNRTYLSVPQGVGVLAVASPILALLCQMLTSSRQQHLKEVEKRVALTTECLSAISQIKLYAYEKYFSGRILAQRQKELNLMRKNVRSRSSLWMIMVSFVT